MRNAIAIAALAALASLAAFASRGNGGAVRGAAARAGMMGGRFTEVQYLQSTGTQYIDTGYAIQSENFYASIKLLVAASQEYENWLFGTSYFYLGTYYYWGVLNGVRAVVYSVNAKDYWGVGTAGAETTLAMRANNGAITAWGNGEQVSGRTYSGSLVTGVHCYLFAVGTTSGVGAKGIGRLYNVQMTDNGILVRDFVPVRDTAGNGYMLDKVTGQLYANAGTGAFIVGPDK